MKNLKIIFLSSFFVLFVSLVHGQTYYYASGKKVNINKLEDTYFVLKTSTDNISIAANSLSSSVSDITVLSSNNYISLVKLKNTALNNARASSVNSLQSNGFLNAYLFDGSNQIVGVTKNIVVKFKNGVSDYSKTDIVSRYGLVLVANKAYGVLYSVKITDDALLIANKLFESQLFEYAHPDFIISMEKTAYIPNDSYFNNQYYLNNTGQIFTDGHSGAYDADVDAPEAWDITKGNSNIVVAVIDEGVTSNHPDLPNSRQVRLNGSNFAWAYDVPTTNPNDPSPYGNGNHGNACAGIIAATQDNSEGVSGIAPLCKIMPVRIPFGVIPSTVYADAITFAVDNGAQILSNSWGYGTNDPNLFPNIVGAIQYAIDNNRVVVFAAGNTANSVANNSGFVNFPGNTLVNGVLTVGASDRYDKKANYSPSSNVGSPFNQIVDLVAPSHRAYSNQIFGEDLEIWTIDIPGTGGYNSGLLPSSGTNNLSYTGRMGGTSAATPLVAGIAALALSVNSNLTNQQVFDLLTCSADDVGGYAYVNGFSNEMGNGRVNAFNVLMSMCIPTLTINWDINNQNGIIYQASDQIVLSKKVTSLSKSKFFADNAVLLLPGTNFEFGSEVSVGIQNCSTCKQFSSLRKSAVSVSLGDEISYDVDQNYSNDQILAFPNPAKSGFVNFNLEATNLSVYDSFGERIDYFQSTSRINISNYASGLYIVRSDQGVTKIIVE